MASVRPLIRPLQARSRRLAGALSLILTLSIPLSPARGSAQESPTENSLEIVFENDIFVGIVPGRPHSDREYTNGLWVASERNDAPVWGAALPHLEPCAAAAALTTTCLQTRLEFGQKIFTPYIQASPPSPTERPYAGWLFGAVTARVAQPLASRSLRVELGVTGPPSMAEDFQKIIHRLTSYPQPRGWDHQLAFEPAIMLQYEERRVLEYTSSSGSRIADLVLSANVAAGSLRTGAQGAIALRAGHQLPHPWIRVDHPEPLGVFGFVEYQRQWTGRDLFLDGNTFEDSPSVERIPFTGALRIGGAIEYEDIRLQFVHVMEDKLYETQPRPHRYSSLSLAINP